MMEREGPVVKLHSIELQGSSIMGGGGSCKYSREVTKLY